MPPSTSHNIRNIRIFVSSPGDVSEERKLVTEAIEDLNREPPLLQDHAIFTPILWERNVYLADRGFQDNIIEPAQCDVVLVIFWSHFGTPLPYPQYQKANDERYLSGTEWEYENAVQAARNFRKPKVIVYRRYAPMELITGDPNTIEKCEQLINVHRFFERFRDEDNAFIGSYHTYKTPEDLGKMVTLHLKQQMPEILSGQPAHPEIPHPPHVFVERSHEKQQILDALAQGRNIGIYGLGGIGKTVLAASVANEWLSKNRRVLWISVGQRKNWSSVYDDIGVELEDSRISRANDGKHSLLRTILQDENVDLIVLDDVWDTEAIQEFVNLALPRACRLLVTGQVRVGIDAFCNVIGLDNANGIDLFCRHAGLEPTNEVQPIIDLLEGHPLALEIAGRMSQIYNLNINDLLERLTSPSAQRTIHQLDLDKEDAQDNIWATLSVSYSALDNEIKRNILKVFGVLEANSATFDFLDQIIDIDSQELLTILDSLIAHSLVMRDHIEDNITIYRVHNLTQLFCQKVLVKEQSFDALKMQMLRASVAYLDRFAEDYQHHYHIQAELVNLMSMAKWAGDNHHWQEVIQFAKQLCWRKNDFLTARGYYAHARELLSWARQAIDYDATQVDKGALLNKLGTAYRELSTYPQAIELYNEALNLSASARLNADIYGNFALTHHNLGEYETAIGYFERALAIARTENDDYQIGKNLSYKGVTLADMGRYPEAIACYKEALTYRIQADDQRGKGVTLGNLGNAHADLGDYAEAMPFYEEAKKIAENVKDWRRLGRHLGNIGRTQYYLGYISEAKKNLEEAIRLHRLVGDRRREARRLGQLANLLRDIGDYAEADSKYEQALSISRHIRDEHGTIYLLNGQGISLRHKDKYNEARKCHDDALAISINIGNKNAELYTYSYLGYILTDLKDFTGALEAYNKALILADEIDTRHGQSFIHSGLGYLYLQQEDYDQAHIECQTSLNLANQIKRVRTQAEAHFYLGNIYFKQNQKQAASTHFHTAHELMDGIQYKRGLADLYFARGTLHDNEHIPSQAVTNFQAACDLYEELDLFDRANHCKSILRRL